MCFVITTLPVLAETSAMLVEICTPTSTCVPLTFDPCQHFCNRTSYQTNPRVLEQRRLQGGTANDSRTWRAHIARCTSSVHTCHQQCYCAQQWQELVMLGTKALCKEFWWQEGGKLAF